jgi:hypothetical protein
MDKAYIFESFKVLKGTMEKVKFLEELRSLNLNLDIKYENLINYYNNLAKAKEEEE